MSERKIGATTQAARQYWEKMTVLNKQFQRFIEKALNDVPECDLVR